MKPRDIFMYALGALIAIGFFTIVAYMIWIGGYQKELGIVLGALVGSFTMVVSYFFGSSKGSAEKNELMKKE